MQDRAVQTDNTGKTKGATLMRRPFFYLGLSVRPDLVGISPSIP